MHKRNAAEANSPSRADVRVSLEGPSRDARFWIVNHGPGDAFDVAVVIEPGPGGSSPLVRGDVDMPIRQLAAGGRVKLIAALTHGTGTVFEGTWTWRHPDGTPGTRSATLSL
jgi:hypothetical protein